MRLALQRRCCGRAAPRKLMVRRAPRDRVKAIIRFGPLVFQAALGRGGISAFKREGDGVTPRARMAVLGGFRQGGQLRALASPLALAPVGPRHGWCDDPVHGAYNRPVRLPFAASAEKLLRNDRLYDMVLVLDWNIRSRARFRGSAIFLHVAREGYRPTEGCVALVPRDLELLLRFIRPGDVVRVM